MKPRKITNLNLCKKKKKFFFQTKMKLLLTIGFLLCISMTIVTSRHCNNLLPGLNRLFRGIDVTKLDLLPLEFTGSHGFKQPIIEATCNQNKKWTLDGVSYVTICGVDATVQ